MSHQFHWHIQDRVVIGVVQGALTLEELQEMNAEILVYLEHGTAPVHVISDVREVTEFPRRITQINKILIYLRHANMGWEIAIGDQNPIVRFIASTVSQMAGVNVSMVKTMEEGLAILSRVDPTIAAELNEKV